MTLSKEQRYAFEQFKQNKNLFITGPGGTGKTFLIQTLVDYMNEHKIKYQVCAMTGCAAMLLHHCKARTLHSWSGIKLARGSVQQVIQRTARNNTAKSNWKGVQVLIVDEVSMMSRRIFDLIDELARMFRCKPRTPFGGIQLIFTGDFYQLPPVGDAEVPHSSEFCFQSDNWYKTFPLCDHIQLVTPFRQKDPEYSAILGEVRRGELTSHGASVLRSHVREYVDDGRIVPTQLYAIRTKTDFVNHKMYAALKTEEVVYESRPSTNCRTYIDSGEMISPQLIDACLSMTEDERKFYLEMMHTNSNTAKKLALKIGAVVMCTVNLNLDIGICNGSQGIVEAFVMKDGHKMPVVRFNNGVRHEIEFHKIQSHDYPTLTLEYVPLVLAWALTIHKIQGSTLDRAIMDLGTSVFEYGQTYVALSRVKSLDGLYLKAFVPQRIKSNPAVKQFYENIPVLPEEIESADIDELVVQIDHAYLTPPAPTFGSANPPQNTFSQFAYGAVRVTKLPADVLPPIIEQPSIIEETSIIEQPSITEEPSIIEEAAAATEPAIEMPPTSECNICMTNKKNILYLPCKHVCVCEACDEKMVRDMITKEKKYRMCPVCRKKIVSKMSVFV